MAVLDQVSCNVRMAFLGAHVQRRATVHIYYAWVRVGLEQLYAGYFEVSCTDSHAHVDFRNLTEPFADLLSSSLWSFHTCKYGQDKTGGWSLLCVILLIAMHMLDICKPVSPSEHCL